jgi:phosphate transport system protein
MIADKHLSTHFDMDLKVLLDKLIFMGASVEMQLKRTLAALSEVNESLLDEIFVAEQKIDALEVTIDEGCSQVIVMRQPVARDLRFVLAVSKAVAILERAADETIRIAKRIRHLAQTESIKATDKANIIHLGEMSGVILKHALDAFANMDVKSAKAIMLEDKAINMEFYNLRDSFMNAMKENPDMITTYLDLLVIVKALERLGDYAKKVAEFIVYVVDGTDMRHQK